MSIADFSLFNGRWRSRSYPLEVYAGKRASICCIKVTMPESIGFNGIRTSWDNVGEPVCSEFKNRFELAALPTRMLSPDRNFAAERPLLIWEKTYNKNRKGHNRLDYNDKMSFSDSNTQK